MTLRKPYYSGCQEEEWGRSLQRISLKLLNLTEFGFDVEVTQKLQHEDLAVTTKKLQRGTGHCAIVELGGRNGTKGGKEKRKA